MKTNAPSKSIRALIVCASILTHALLSAAEPVADKAEKAEHIRRNSQDSVKHPNFIVILTDDQGYQDVGCFGAPKIKTPALDRMATEGMRFTDFYSGASLCSASRAALMTGSHPVRLKIPSVLFPYSSYSSPAQEGLAHGLNPDEITIAEILKGEGYATAIIGKWHLGDAPEFLPTRQGFDSFFGTPCSNNQGITIEGRMGAPLMRNETIIEHPLTQKLLTQRYTEEALAFIRKKQKEPFFLYLASNMPHVPLAASDAFRGKSKGGLYGDTIEEIDWAVGRILQALRDLKLDKNTFVIFTSDNGPWLACKDQGGCAEPLRDGKFTHYEGGVRVPCIAWWPGHIPAGTTQRNIASTMDLLPTLAGWAGAPVPTDRVLDGKDISAMMRTPNGSSPHEALCWRGAIRSGKWKLSLGGNRTKESLRPMEKFPQLYDLENDIGEWKNVATEHPEVVERLSQIYMEQEKDWKDRGRTSGEMPVPRTLPPFQPEKLNEPMTTPPTSAASARSF